MKVIFKSPLIFSILILGAIGCASLKNQNSYKIENDLNYLAKNLDSATFFPIRTVWQYNYGFKEGWLLNKYEYVRSLLTYRDFQTKLKYPIFLSGPHTSDKLNLNSQHSFGHYNPQFVTQLHKSALQLLNDDKFILITKPILEKHGILEFLKKNKDIYEIIKNNPEDFNRIKSDFLTKIKNKTLVEGEYRTNNMLPSMLNSPKYWNWSETSYHFWVRRDIDNTKQIWINLIGDVLKAYE